MSIQTIESNSNSNSNKYDHRHEKGDSQHEGGVQTLLTRTWVVFTGKTEIRWLRILKPGFRHCFVLFHDGTHWVSVDPLSNYTDIAVHQAPADFDFPLWFERRGYRVVPARVERSLKQAPLGGFTCVEAVKRMIGLHNRFIITPWQLYRHLTAHTITTNSKGGFLWGV